MNLYTEAKVSPVGKVNAADLKKIALNTAQFFSAPALIYFAQLMGTLNTNHFLLIPDFIPGLMTVGAIEAWAIGIAVNFFLKFNDGKK